MIFVFSLILSIIFDKSTPGNYTITLPSGKYIFECYGAQGGDGKDKSDTKIGEGGKGAYAAGTMIIEGEILFYLNVGGQGESNTTQQNNGGFNGGGKSGKSTKNKAISGGGGGATDVRIYTNEISNRIIVAAGGSGGVGQAQGASGGTENGRWINYEGYINPEYIERESDKTTQTKGNGIEGIGGDGADHEYGAGSGGGGGWMGGISTGEGGENVNLGYDTFYKGVSHSGSSYISGYSRYCGTTLDITLLSPKWESGKQTGNGRLIITEDYACPENCHSCLSTTTHACTKCLTNYYLYNNGCVMMDGHPFQEQNVKNAPHQTAKFVIPQKRSVTNVLTIIIYMINSVYQDVQKEQELPIQAKFVKIVHKNVIFVIHRKIFVTHAKTDITFMKIYVIYHVQKEQEIQIQEQEIHVKNALRIVNDANHQMILVIHV